MHLYELCLSRIQTDRMHLMEHICGIIFGFQLLQLAQFGTVDVGDSRVTGYIVVSILSSVQS